MKKYIFTETQMRKIVNHLVKEEESQRCSKGTLKNAKFVGFENSEIEEIKNSGKFTVVYGTMNGGSLNGKPTKEGMIITPNTDIVICMSSSINISGMGYNEAYISYGGENQVTVNSQRP